MARRLDVVFAEIDQAIAGITEATQGKSFEEFSESWVLRHAVQRGIEIISEATRHVPDELLATCPGIPWPSIRAIGNLLRHEYHRIADAVIWAVVTDDLPALQQALATIRRNLNV